MKKIALFFAALVVAMASFAAIPTKSDLAPYYEPGQLCVCVQFEEQVCNDIVFAGSYNAWNTIPAEMAHFAPLKGFNGWYYVAVTDNSATIEGKPVQLRSDGSFSWDYQGGDAKAWTIHSGYVNILPGYNGECDLKNYATAEPIIMTCAYFKNHNTPCGQVVVSQTYTIRLKAPACIGADGTFYEPAIIGSFNGWAEGIAADHIDRNTSEYVFLIKDAVGGEFKFKALGDTDWSNEIMLWDEISQYWYAPANIVLGTDTEISIDYSAGRYTKCVEDVVVEDPIKDYTIRLLAPDCAGEDGTHYEPAIIGSFNDWTEGVAANYIDDKTGEYVFHITDSVGGTFKFRALGDTDWSNQIQLLDEEYGWWYDNYEQILGTDIEISIDYSTGRYTLCVEDVVVEDSIKAYTIRLLAPDCAGADGTHYQPAIIGSFNDWTEGVAANYIDDSTGEYVFIITDKVGGEFKFKALGDTDWTNEIQLQDELGNWYNPQNITLGTDTEIRIDYSAGRYTLCVEDAPPTSDIPTNADLAPYYEPGQLCVCIKFEEQVCNDIVFAGSYNAWNTNPAEMAHFAPLIGFDGWYYVAVTDNSATIEGKPVQLKADGSFSWDYQGGDAKAWTIHSGYVDILPGYNGECDLKNYANAEPIIMTCAYFKNHNSPCKAEVYQDYTIRLLAPSCAGADGTHYQPAIIGDFNNWTEGIAANYIDEETHEYVFLINAMAGSSFKFRALSDTDWSNEIIVWDEISQYWYASANIVLGTDTEISIDYSMGKYTLCVEDTPPTGNIVYELNGGVTNDDGWLSKGDMWKAFCADAGVTTLGNLDDLKAAGDGSHATICTPLGTTQCQAILDNEKWDWLEAYIMTVQNADAAATVLTEGASSAGWRYAMAAFFLENKRAAWPVSADFTIAGTVEAFQPAWKHAFANPTEPTGEWVLNAPYKEGYTFDGWYATADFSGERVKVIDATTTGTLYAKWVEYISTIAEVKALADDTETKVAGVVNFISGKNVYIQDATGGILVYTTETPNLKVGERIVAKGVKVMYGGAPEVKSAVIESAEAAELPTVVAFENLATLIADTEFKHFATRVSVPGLKIVSYDSYNNPTVEDALGNQALCYRMVLDPVEFPIGKKVKITAVAGWYNGFQFVGDAAGIELVPIGVKDQYNYPVRHEKYTLTNNWVISNVEENYAAKKPGSNDMVRGMAAKDGIMYFINRETESLVRVNGATGDMLDPLKITGDHLFQVPSIDAETGETSWSEGVTIKFNDLKFDQAGNCLISGLITSQNQYFMVYEVDLETGAATLVVSEKLSDNPDYAEIPCRFDAFGVNGDIHGNACIMAADATNGSWNTYRWLIEDGVVGKAKLIKINSIEQSLFKNATWFGTAPQIFPKDETGSLFYVDGFYTTPMLFNESGTLVDDFINVPTGLLVANQEGDTIEMNTGHNGLMEFQVGNEYFLIMAATNTAHNVPSTFALYKFADKYRSFKGLEPLWYFPANGMGTTTNGCRVAMPSVEVEGNTATIYLYVNNNGYASYTLHVDSAEIPDPNLTDYTIRLLAPNCAGADGTHYQPAIIGSFNDWTEGVAANYIDDKTGEYVFHITDYMGGEFKFKALGDTDWTNEIQLQDELGNWYNPQNLTLGTDTEIRIDYSAGRYTLCQEEIITLDPEYVTICYGDTYYWYGNIYSETGEYTVQFDNFIQTLYLTVLPEALVSEENLTITESELPYTWHNLVLSAAGDYYDAIPYVQTGCDSIVYILHLNVEPAVVANQCGDNLYWTYEPSTKELSITGYGDMYNYTTWTQPWNTIVHAIRHITLPEDMTSIGTSAFADCMYTTSITIPASVEIIADRAFENCRMLSDLTFAEGGALSMIGNWAFYNCHELKHIAIPEGVTEIGYAAFYGCTYLSELTLPASMEHIADNGFALCAKLTSMTVNATVPPTVAARTFEDVDRTIPVYVPQESVDLYKAAPVWQEFYIVGKVASSLENHAATDNCQKLIRDGQLIIIHDGKTYNAMGQEL